ncbi:MAG TPA: hypothetical protein VFB78_14920 [Acidimicrobiales bacterium]|nr:hypothetical protein [Acidimicrobiales bacterium]
MKSVLKKLAVGGVAVAALALAGPGNLAFAAGGGGGGGGGGANNPQRAAVRACVTQGQHDRTKAENKFRQAIRAAHDLPRDQQQAAVQAAQQAFQTAAQKANADFQTCVENARDA